LEEEGIQVTDLGIVPDNKELIRDRMLRASAECDVVIASGGVSMGDKDFVKPLLEELGTVSCCNHCIAGRHRVFMLGDVLFVGPLWPAQHEAGQADHLRFDAQTSRS
jgi:hypothetical protein